MGEYKFVYANVHTDEQLAVLNSATLTCATLTRTQSYHPQKYLHLYLYDTRREIYPNISAVRKAGHPSTITKTPDTTARTLIG